MASQTPGDAPGGTPGFELGTDGPAVIVAGMDGTTTASHAVAYAIGLARRQRARLIAVFVIPGASVTAAGQAGASVLLAQERANQQVAGELRERLRELSAPLGVSAEFIVAYGDPYAEIRRLADQMRADAIVVGASAKAGHRLVGSVAVRLVRAGRWPVTVVP